MTFDRSFNTVISVRPMPVPSRLSSSGCSLEPNKNQCLQHILIHPISVTSNRPSLSNWTPNPTPVRVMQTEPNSAISAIDPALLAQGEPSEPQSNDISRNTPMLPDRADVLFERPAQPLSGCNMRPSMPPNATAKSLEFLQAWIWRRVPACSQRWGWRRTVLVIGHRLHRLWRMSGGALRYNNLNLSFLEMNIPTRRNIPSRDR
jgi:hypothetical protein